MSENVFVTTGPIVLSCRDSRLVVFSVVGREPRRLISSAGKILLDSGCGGAL